MKQVFLLCIPLLFVFCKAPDPVPETIIVEGATMGTTFRVVYLDKQDRDLSIQLDSLLKEVNQELSTYIPTSTISAFNQSDTGILITNSGQTPHLELVFNKSIEINRSSAGNFDPTIAPLTNYWGFGYTEKKMVTAIDSSMVDSLKSYMGIDKISLSEVSSEDLNIGKEYTIKLNKTRPEVKLDVNAIAKGYGVDALGLMLESKGVSRYLVEIGGEVRARGKNSRDLFWTFGLASPYPGAEPTDIEQVITLQDLSAATSGNYRNFYEKDGKKYAHTINPFTGFPQPSTLLSATVFADDCMTADAYATAFMVMGRTEARKLVDSLPGIEALFIYSNEKGELETEITEGAKKLVL